MSALKHNPSDHGAEYAGVHLLVEFWDARPVDDPARLEQIIREAARQANCQVVHAHCHLFAPHGITGVAILAESHLSVHSWPELNYLAIDIFTCGTEALPRLAVEYLERELRPGQVEVTEVKRGRRGARIDH